MIKSWVFELFVPPAELAQRFDPAVSQRHFNAYLDLWASAESAGFDGIFFSEHHFGATYSPAPNLLIASVALRTKKIRLGVMGMVPPYHSPWQLVEEIGMLDHLTGGRLEIGTAAGIPQEMAQIGLGVDEARARYDEAVAIMDKALAEPVISHHGKFWNFDNLRMIPRPVQQPHPPTWATVVSVSSARKAARRGAKITTGFHPMNKVIEIFDAYREEADKAGRKTTPDDLCIRRQVLMLEDEEALAKRRNAFREFIRADPRVDFPDRPAMLDSPSAHTFSIGDEEFISGKADRCCRRTDHRPMPQRRRGKFCRAVRSHGDARAAHGLLPRFWRGNDSPAAQRRSLGPHLRTAEKLKAAGSDRCFVRRGNAALRRELVDIVRQFGAQAPQQLVAGHSRFPRQSIERVGSGRFLQTVGRDRLVRPMADPGLAGIP
jgi:alkanesulfonate monooxygenase SsuD/methylene tetrahydromethanopterin reductase-like flavin-dependent oxidoreductase (luciferase family)